MTLKEFEERVKHFNSYNLDDKYTVSFFLGLAVEQLIRIEEILSENFDQRKSRQEYEIKQEFSPVVDLYD